MLRVRSYRASQLQSIYTPQNWISSFVSFILRTSQISFGQTLYLQSSYSASYLRNPFHSMRGSNLIDNWRYLISQEHSFWHLYLRVISSIVKHTYKKFYLAEAPTTFVDCRKTHCITLILLSYILTRSAHSVVSFFRSADSTELNNTRIGSDINKSFTQARLEEGGGVRFIVTHLAAFLRLIIGLPQPTNPQTPNGS